MLKPNQILVNCLLSMHFHPMVHQIIPEREPLATTLTWVRHHPVLLSQMQVKGVIVHITSITLIALGDSFLCLVLVIPVLDHFGARGKILSTMARIGVE